MASIRAVAASVISPYVVRTLGPRHARHSVLTAETMHAIRTLLVQRAAVPLPCLCFIVVRLRSRQ